MSKQVIITSPSGGGKTSVTNEIIALLPEVFDRAISHTTRPPRDGEVDGVDYHFVTIEEFTKLLPDMFASTEYYGYMYGTLKSEADTDKDFTFLVMDYKGYTDTKRAYPDAISIFLYPTDRDTLRERLEARGMDIDSIKIRLVKYYEEVANATKYNYIVDNTGNDIQEAVNNILKVLNNAE